VNTRSRGALGEDTAVDYLRKKGYRILARNFRYERGEIDIVAEDQHELVFIEVKARRTKRFGDPEDAITAAKCRQLWKVAEGYLFQHELEDKECRFDVVAIEYMNNVPVIRHLIDAF
jgi:putative endonuclease